MNRTRSTLIGTAVAIALFGPNDRASAQAAAAEKGLEEIIVSGIRYSNQVSLDSKREAESRVEVITAEDIGKMPDKNVADSLSRVVGVTTSSASANEGGFDENDRISMRGTNASLTQTLLNGHNVAAGDWFVLNQVEQIGRSVSYTLLPSELVGQVVVHKSSEASLVEGGVAGSVDIITRRPLDFSEQMTISGSVGAVFAELPDETDPQISALFNWKNDADTFGVMLQGFSEDRHLRRDGVEILGYRTIASGSAVALSNPDLAGVEYPRLIGAALFEQERKRTGGLIDLEFRPTDDLRLDLQGFLSDLDATNYNRNYMVWAEHFVADGAGQAPDPGYVVRNNTLVQASFSPALVDGMGCDPTPEGVLGPTCYGIYDQISRPDEKASSNYISFEAEYRVNDGLEISGQIGTSEGHGETPTQDVSETLPGAGNGTSWQLQGLGSAPNFAFGDTDNSTPFPDGTPQSLNFGWIFGAQFVDVEDEEDWAKIDADFAVDRGVWNGLQFGVRYNEHKRESKDAIAQGPTFGGGTTGGGGVDPAAYPTTFTNYPSDFNTFGGNIPTNVWYWSPSQLAEYNGGGNTQRDPIERAFFPLLFTVEEENAAGYVQANLKGSNWSGNIGLRYVRTDEHVVTYTATTADDPDAILGSLFGPFKGIPVDNSYDDWLPSANLKWEISDELVARFAASRTMTRADYSALGGSTNLIPPATPGGIGSGSGGNPDLEPIRSWNYDAGIEWYFADNSLLAATVFYMDLENYVTFGSETKTYFTYSSQFPDGANVDYLLTVPVNAEGRVQGFELSYQQAITENFGIAANYTYADGEQTSLVTTGDDRLVGTSEDTYNLSAYYETSRFNARVTYTFRSAFFSGLDRNTAFSQDDTDSLAASVGYTFSDNFSVTLDGQNLNDSTLKYYARNEDQPRSFYKNGAQYYLNLRFKF
jgi:iron complex outermembrane receptor protein